MDAQEADGHDVVAGEAVPRLLSVATTYDIVQGLDQLWLPPSRLCGFVLARLFPDTPAGDPGAVLLWTTGREALDGHPAVRDWVWKAARP